MAKRFKPIVHLHYRDNATGRYISESDARKALYGSYTVERRVIYVLA